MGTTRKWAQGRRLRALTTALVLAALAALLLAGTAQAAKPGKPTAKTPTGTIKTTTPTFTWSKAARAATYEVRAYKGSTLLVKKTGIARLSWKSSKVLPRGVALTWKVRGRKAGVNGAWSSSRAFRVAPLSSAKAITAFSFQGLDPPVVGAVTEADHTVILTVPYGTDVSALAATFTTSGATVKVGSALQTSGVTANDFSSPVVYTVTAADASTQNYTVTVTVAAKPVAIGDAYQGGIVAYILQPGDPGYVAGQTRGLIAATADQTAPGGPSGVPWSTAPYWNTSVPGTSTALGSGPANTTAIIAQNGAGSTYAAGLARAYTSGGYSDWYLPSKDELGKLYLNRVAIGGFETTTYPLYSSSSEYQSNADYAWTQLFDTGTQRTGDVKETENRVRAVRTFAPAGVATQIAVNAGDAQSATVSTAVATAPSVIIRDSANDPVANVSVTFAVASGDGSVTGATTTTNAAGIATVGSWTLGDALGANTLTATCPGLTGSPVTFSATGTVAIGDAYQGGKVAYVLQPGDPGYVAGQPSGLIAATVDQSAGIPWWNGSYTDTGATAMSLGTGSANTTAIIASQGETATSYAAGLARAYNGGGYSDWYLPSMDELYWMIVNRAAIGGFDTNPYGEYWSSSECPGHDGALAYFYEGYPGYGFMMATGKQTSYGVRAVRWFPADSSKAITAFSFQGLDPAVTGTVTQAGHTIALTVPFGTAVTGLVATFTTDGAVVAVGSTVQASGVTANDFTGPVKYTVTAADASTQDYTVTVTVAAP